MTTVRLAVAGEAQAIAAVKVAAYRAAYRGLVPDVFLDRPAFEGDEAAHVRAALSSRSPTGHVAVAIEGGVLVGFVSYGVLDDPHLATGAIYDLFVDPGSWRCGIGSRLVEWATDYFMSIGLTEAHLFVFEGNTDARKFYARAGWQADRYREVDDRTGVPLPTLRYRIRLEGHHPER